MSELLARYASRDRCLTFGAAVKNITQKRLTVERLVQVHLDHIRAENDRLKAFLSREDDEAIL